MAQISLKPTFCDAATGFPVKWRLRNKPRNSILMTCHYPYLGSASDWLTQISHEARPIRSTIEIWVVRRHQYGISMLVSQTSFRGETNGGFANFCLFSARFNQILFYTSAGSSRNDGKNRLPYLNCGSPGLQRSNSKMSCKWKIREFHLWLDVTCMDTYTTLS